MHFQPNNVEQLLFFLKNVGLILLKTSISSEIEEHFLN